MPRDPGEQQLSLIAAGWCGCSLHELTELHHWWVICQAAAGPEVLHRKAGTAQHCVRVCFCALQAVHPDIQQQVFDELVAAGLAPASESGWKIGITQPQAG